MLVAAFALSFQSYIAQTHMHDDAIGAGSVPRHAAAPGKAPSEHGTAGCPLCQAIIHVGAFVASANVALYLPFAWVEAAPLAHVALRASITTAHDWRSRAPPQP
jgi:hypothetical protein